MAALVVALTSFLVSGSFSASSTSDILMLMTGLGCTLLMLRKRSRFPLVPGTGPSVLPLRVATVGVWIISVVVLICGATLVGPSFELRSFLLVALPSSALLLLSFIRLWNDGKGGGVSDGSPKCILVGGAADAPAGLVKVVVARSAEPRLIFSSPCGVYVGADHMGSLLPGEVSTFCVTPGKHPVFLVFSGVAGPVEYVDGQAGDTLEFIVRRREKIGLLAQLLRPGVALALQRSLPH
ncbi:hypothetical protein OUQ99_12010 [Streptomonospora nanhaiensis]|uniref:Uncharacterized protein n=1 Tax=Streptomonospora nanhaiensis TaxID=1323731 RepID=A0ABY6YUS8_9ACTN|nr:hypothetical protein [Streptomonospora nanhaiensis]WAE75746.1 hypothetical protein OUQ99_12010 [Streptomonospora nanhaiensis]